MSNISFILSQKKTLLTLTLILSFLRGWCRKGSFSLQNEALKMTLNSWHWQKPALTPLEYLWRLVAYVEAWGGWAPKKGNIIFLFGLKKGVLQNKACTYHSRSCIFAIDHVQSIQSFSAGHFYRTGSELPHVHLFCWLRLDPSNQLSEGSRKTSWHAYTFEWVLTIDIKHCKMWHDFLSSGQAEFEYKSTYL